MEIELGIKYRLDSIKQQEMCAEESMEEQDSFDNS